MFHHVQLSVRDFQQSLRLYTSALAPLGYVPQHLDAAGQSVGFGPPGRVALWLTVGTRSRGPVHLAFSAPDARAVAAFHAAALQAGAQDHGAPGPRPDYGPSYHAAFVLDPDGNNLEAVVG